MVWIIWWYHGDVHVYDQFKNLTFACVCNSSFCVSTQWTHLQMGTLFGKLWGKWCRTQNDWLFNHFQPIHGCNKAWSFTLCFSLLIFQSLCFGQYLSTMSMWKTFFNISLKYFLHSINYDLLYFTGIKKSTNIKPNMAILCFMDLCFCFH